MCAGAWTLVMDIEWLLAVAQRLSDFLFIPNILKQHSARSAVEVMMYFHSGPHSPVKLNTVVDIKFWCHRLHLLMHKPSGAHIPPCFIAAREDNFEGLTQPNVRWVEAVQSGRLKYCWPKEEKIPAMLSIKMLFQIEFTDFIKYLCTKFAVINIHFQLFKGLSIRLFLVRDSNPHYFQVVGPKFHPEFYLKCGRLYYDATVLNLVSSLA